MEFDCSQHYFFNYYDTEEDFYKSTAPSEDIWKKFELLPTPPMSPTRTLSGAPPPLSPGDKLSWLTKVLGQDEECEGQFLPDKQQLLGNLSAHIIRDCMWSCFSASKQLEKVNGRASAAAQSVAPPLAQITVRPGKAQCVSPAAAAVAAAAAAAAATDCVDPAAVLTFPAASGCRKPASSGSESRSDSSDDDDDEEEIDVVTVESKQNRVRLVNVRKPVTITVRADPCPRRFHMSVHRQQHNYAARSPDSDPEEDDDDDDEEEDEEEEEEEEYEEPPRKRRCGAGSQPVSPSETPANSDAEDVDRRRNHNFLERKRRNDLRSRFLALRDQIPGLESAKTPKVAILTQATEYLLELHGHEKRHLQEVKRLKTRRKQLLNRLAELKRS